MPWHAYSLAPIDWWIGWTRYHPPTTEPTSPEGSGSPYDDDYMAAVTARHAWLSYQAALQEFPRHGWEGDGHWYYSGLPRGDGSADSELVLAVKQQNNGTVFVLSPVPLLHLGPLES